MKAVLLNYKFHFSFLFLLFLLDQITKQIFFGKEILITSFFSITPIENTGTFFGFFQNTNIFFILLSFLMIVFLLYFFQKEKQFQWSFVWIIAGALANVVDRIIFGFVRDFFYLRYWPVFNLADLFIVGGLVLILLRVIKEKREMFK